MSQNLQALMDDISNWSDATFGSGQRTIPIVCHLKKEVDELRDALAREKELYSTTDEVGVISRQKQAVEMEFADCFMLLLNAAHHHGITASDFMRFTRHKLAINRKRKWGMPDKDGVVEHID